MAAVDVVICTYRSSAHIRPCLDSLRAAADVVATTTVVDNASDDGTAALVAGHDPAVRVVEMGGNTGFARAVNRGIAAGRARYVFVLNPDTVVAEGAPATLVRFAQAHPRAGVVAPRLLHSDGRDQLTARAFPTPAAGLFGRRSPLTRVMPNNRWSARYLSGRRHTGDGAFQIDWVSGAAMLVPRQVIDEVGALDEAFFLFWEDADWCRRIKAAGYSGVVRPVRPCGPSRGRLAGVRLEPGHHQIVPPGRVPLLEQAPCPTTVEPLALGCRDAAADPRIGAAGPLVDARAVARPPSRPC